MSIQTNLEGRLRNTSLAKKDGLLPIFEAVVNSIHSIEEKENYIRAGCIDIHISRSHQSTLDIGDSSVKKDIVGFIIKDNGSGFNENNMKSFETLDSDHKIKKGCRGVGRLLWLKVFDSVHVTSTYVDVSTQVTRQRKFSFSSKGIDQEPIQDTHDDIQTIVELRGFKNQYDIPKTVAAIANALLEHCLWYFIRSEGVPKIRVFDEGEDVIDLGNLYDNYKHEKVATETIEIKGYFFNLTHIKLSTFSRNKHTLSLCAANRLVKEETITAKQLSGLHTKITDDKGEFYYTCYVSSPFLDETVRPERNAFNIADDTGGIFSDTDISLKDIREQVLNRTRVYLSVSLASNIQAGRERIDKFVETTAPIYRSIVQHMTEQDLAVDPSTSDKELELHLHKIKTVVAEKMHQQGQEIKQLMLTDNFATYEAKLEQYLKTVDDVKKSDLVEYVTHRKVILELLEQAVQKTSSGKYLLENVIHNLIMPMKKDSNQVSLDNSNLWLIDERLAFHNYLASDKALTSTPITDNNSLRNPDIIALNVYDNPLIFSDKSTFPLASITVVELKRPMRDDMSSSNEKNPIEQVKGYINLIRQGKVKTSTGRPIPESDNIPCFCYIICDLTASMKELCDNADLIVTNDKMGYFGFHKKYNAYFEVISYDRLIQAGKERNRAFFDKLGLPNS